MGGKLPRAGGWDKITRGILPPPPPPAPEGGASCPRNEGKINCYTGIMDCINYFGIDGQIDR